MKTCYFNINKIFTSLFAVLISLFFINLAHAQILVNIGDSPSSATWTATDVGWYVTPSTTFTAYSIGTEFGSSGSNVTAELFTAVPSSGGTLLGSGTFNPVGDQLSFATLDIPVVLTAGTPYFVGFKNVANLSVNFTDDSGATDLAPLYYDVGNANTFNNAYPNDGTAILEVGGVAAAPEPSTWALMLGGLGLLAFFRARARRA